MKPTDDQDVVEHPLRTFVAVIATRLAIFVGDRQALSTAGEVNLRPAV